MFVEEREIFGYENGVLGSKLLAFEDVGLSKASVVNLVATSPSLLTEDVKGEFVKFLEVIIVDFIENMKQGLAFLIEIGMETKQIVKIVHSHLQILGSCSFKRPNSVLVKLNVGKKRLCGIIKEDPNQLKNWVFGSKISPLPKPSRDPRLMQKTAFLVTLGFTEGSDEMKNALKLFQGSSVELQERFNCLVRAGLKPTDVSNMIKADPHVLSQSRDMLQKKIDFFVNSLGFPLESLLEFPRYMSYTIERVKLRFLMYKWLKDQEKVIPTLALSTILVCSEKVFALQYVNRHPKGPENKNHTLDISPATVAYLNRLCYRSVHPNASHLCGRKPPRSETPHPLQRFPQLISDLDCGPLIRWTTPWMWDFSCGVFGSEGFKEKRVEDSS
ncbi:hypothetical protein AAC387_Pa11g0609 [Persea americana]